MKRINNIKIDFKKIKKLSDDGPGTPITPGTETADTPA